MSDKDQEKISESYYLGLDGGGSKTLAVIVDAQGRERGKGLAGCSNYNVVGIEKAIVQLQLAVHEAVQAAKCALPLEVALFGLAGVDRVEDHNLLFPLLQPFANSVHLKNDAELLLSALDDDSGIALIAGTGSIAFGRNARGKMIRTGGWGHIVGDEGSGYEMGRLALQAVLRAYDGRGPETILLELLSEQWQLTNVSDIVEHVYSEENKAKIARLSVLVCQAARDGDVAAQSILSHTADELALAVVTVSNQLGCTKDGIALALGGGLLVHEQELRQQVIERIRRHVPIQQLMVVEHPAFYAAKAAIKFRIADTCARRAPNPFFHRSDV